MEVGGQVIAGDQMLMDCYTAFDPTAFIGALEQAVDELIPLRKDVAQQTQRAEKHVEAAESQYSTKVKELRDNFNVSGSCHSVSEYRSSHALHKGRQQWLPELGDSHHRGWQNDSPSR